MRRLTVALVATVAVCVVASGSARQAMSLAPTAQATVAPTILPMADETTRLFPEMDERAAAKEYANQKGVILSTALPANALLDPNNSTAQKQHEAEQESQAA